MSTKVLLIFLFFSYFLIQSFLFSYFFEWPGRWTPCKALGKKSSSRVNNAHLWQVSWASQLQYYLAKILRDNAVITRLINARRFISSVEHMTQKQWQFAKLWWKKSRLGTSNFRRILIPQKSHTVVVAAAVSEPEASERGSSLIGKKSHHRGIESLFVAKRNELWLCANETFRMRNGLARNFGYARMKHLWCAMGLQGILVMCGWKI